MVALVGILALSAAAVGIAWGSGSWNPSSVRMNAEVRAICAQRWPTSPRVARATLPNRRRQPALEVDLAVCQPVVVAGTSIHAVATFHNSSRRPVDVFGCPGQVYVFGVGTAEVPFNPAYLQVLCGTDLIFPSGLTRLSVTIGTTYQACSLVGPSGAGVSFEPACIVRGRHVVGAPALPPGEYQAQLAGTSASSFALVPGDLSITLLPSSG
jgi:hypothetical protein